MNYIFDFDGTIADSLPAMIAIYNKNIRNNVDPLTTDEIQKLRGMSSRRAIKNLGVRWWQVPKLLIQGMPDFKALIPTLSTFKGLPMVIIKLHNRGDRLFIVTSNTRESVEEFLRQAKLDSYFEDIKGSASLFNKSKHLRKLIKQYGLKRRDTYYIGDETRDIQAARLAGIKIISVSWGFNTAEVLKKRRPTLIVNEPEELLEVDN